MKTLIIELNFWCKHCLWNNFLFFDIEFNKKPKIEWIWFQFLSVPRTRDDSHLCMFKQNPHWNPFSCWIWSKKALPPHFIFKAHTLNFQHSWGSSMPEEKCCNIDVMQLCQYVAPFVFLSKHQTSTYPNDVLSLHILISFRRFLTIEPYIFDARRINFSFNILKRSWTVVFTLRHVGNHLIMRDVFRFGPFSGVNRKCYCNCIFGWVCVYAYRVDCNLEALYHKREFVSKNTSAQQFLVWIEQEHVSKTLLIQSFCIWIKYQVMLKIMSK